MAVSEAEQANKQPVTVLVAGLSTILLLFVIVIAVGINRLQLIEDKMMSIAGEHAVQISISGKMSRLARERSLMLMHIVTTEDPFERDTYHMEFVQLGSEFAGLREQLMKLNLYDEELALLKEQGELSTQAVALQRRVVEIATEGRLHDAHALLENEAMPAQNKVIKLFDRLMTLQSDHNQILYKQARTVVGEAVGLMLLLLFVVILVGVNVGIVVVRRVQVYSRSLEESAGLLADSNEALRRSVLQERLVRENIMDAIVTVDEFGIIDSCNPAAAQMFGYEREEMLGKNVSILMPESQGRQHDGHMAQFRKDKGEGRHIGIPREQPGRRKDGSIFPMEIGITRMAMDDHLKVIGIMRDITMRKRIDEALQRNQEQLQEMVAQRTRELEQVNERLHYLACHDGLTSLPNREMLHEELKTALARAHRNKRKVALLFIDLDGFKQVNDELGHDTGDRVLTDVSEFLRRCARESDVIARIGGDEFVVVMPDLERGDDAERLAQRIIEQYTLSDELLSADLTLGFSIGISLYPDDAEDEETLLNRADSAMYRSKHSGKNRYTFYSA